MKTSIIIISAILVLFVGGLAIKSFIHPAVASMPDWSLTRLDGSSSRLSDYSGKVRLLNFWASWCGTCREEMPDLVDLNSKLSSQPFTVLSINYGESKDAAQSFATSYGANFPIFLDQDKKVASSYGVTTIPASVLLDKSGKIVKMWVGQINPGEVKPIIENLLVQN